MTVPDVTGSSWLLWAFAICSGMISARVSTVMARGGVEQDGPLAILQALSFVAVLGLMAVPFFGVAWYLALIAAIGGSFVNPAMLLLPSGSYAGAYRLLPFLNLCAIAGAAYLAWRVAIQLRRGYGVI